MQNKPDVVFWKAMLGELDLTDPEVRKQVASAAFAVAPGLALSGNPPIVVFRRMFQIIRPEDLAGKEVKFLRAIGRNLHPDSRSVFEVLPDDWKQIAINDLASGDVIDANWIGFGRRLSSVRLSRHDAFSLFSSVSIDQ